MKFLLQASFPTDVFNAAVKDGTVQSKIGRIMESVHPEAAYFTEVAGQRTCLLVVNLGDASEIPRTAEPLFLTFNASVQWHICMTPEDLGKAALGNLGKTWG